MLVKEEFQEEDIFSKESPNERRSCLASDAEGIDVRISSTAAQILLSESCRRRRNSSLNSVRMIDFMESRSATDKVVLLGRATGLVLTLERSADIATEVGIGGTVISSTDGSSST
jgi:hypothetical protein